MDTKTQILSYGLNKLPYTVKTILEIILGFEDNPELCYMSNQYFQKILKKKPRTVENAISYLKTNGLVIVIKEGSLRYLIASRDTVVEHFRKKFNSILAKISKELNRNKKGTKKEKVHTIYTEKANSNPKLCSELETRLRAIGFTFKLNNLETTFGLDLVLKELNKFEKEDHTSTISKGGLFRFRIREALKNKKVKTRKQNNIKKQADKILNVKVIKYIKIRNDYFDNDFKLFLDCADFESRNFINMQGYSTFDDLLNGHSGILNDFLSWILAKNFGETN